MAFAIFGKFHAREGAEKTLMDAIREVAIRSREEVGCLALHWFRATRDPRLFIVYSEWTDEAAFDVHAELPHTVQFLSNAADLIDHPLEPVIRTERII